MTKLKRELNALIEANVYPNGHKQITGQKLQNVLKGMIQGHPDVLLPCDPSLTTESIGRTIGIDPTDGLAKIYQCLPAVEGAAPEFLVTFNSVTPDPEGKYPSATLVFSGQPTLGDFFAYKRGTSTTELTVTFTDDPEEVDGAHALIGATLADTLVNLKNTLTTESTTDENSITITLEDYDAVNETHWYLNINASGNVYFSDPLNPQDRYFVIPSIASDEGPTAPSMNVNADSYNSYETPPTNTTEEAENFATYINSSIEGWSAVWGEDNTVTLTPNEALAHGNNVSVESEGIDAVVTTTVEGVYSLPERSAWVAAGFLSGVYEEEGLKYAIISSDLIVTAVLAPHTPIDLTHYDTLAPSRDEFGALRAYNNGTVARYTHYRHSAGLLGAALQNATDSDEEQPVIMKVGVIF